MTWRPTTETRMFDPKRVPVADTGKSRGRCPSCSYQWEDTACLSCSRWSRHADWYETSTWEYLGIRNDREERWPASAAAYREAARRLPSPNLLRQLAAAETHAGEIDSARAVYRFMLSRNPNDDIAWLGLAVLSFRLADYAEAKRAAQELLRIHPDDRNALALLDRIARVTAAVADSTRP